MYGQDHKYFEDVEIGDTWESPPRSISQEDIKTFAHLTGDFNPIHLNADYAATTPFGQTIAHGLLTLARSSGMSIDHPKMRTIAVISLNNVKFHLPVFPGDVLRVKTSIVGKERRGRGKRGLITWHRVVLNQHDKTVQEGESVTLVEAREFPERK